MNENEVIQILDPSEVVNELGLNEHKLSFRTSFNVPQSYHMTLLNKLRDHIKLHYDNQSMALNLPTCSLSINSIRIYTQENSITVDWDLSDDQMASSFLETLDKELKGT